MGRCEYCENDTESPSFKGNQIRGNSCECDTKRDDDEIDVKWHWNRTIGKDD